MERITSSVFGEVLKVVSTLSNAYFSKATHKSHIQKGLLLLSFNITSIQTHTSSFKMLYNSTKTYTRLSLNWY